ncbi:MAG: type II toxin-antitoxin system HicB family antitoxin [Euryarchaeota archaeon]|nr:type II toxin-antitoxin system HicB family antitoxin [Euryarchaeota archaeon]
MPSLPGCVSQGERYEEALENIKEAIELYIDNAKERGLIVDVETALTSSRKFTSITEVTALSF